MRKSYKTLIASVIACTLVGTLAFNGTLAYLTDTKGATNIVTVGKVQIDLEEPGYPGNNSDEVKRVIPNQEIVKDPQVENTGNNAALIYLKVDIPQENFTEMSLDGTLGEKKMQDLFALKGLDGDWELIKTEPSTNADTQKTKTTYVYAYRKPLEKGATTSKLFDKVQMKNAIENDLSGNVEDIVITACAIQATDIPGKDLTMDADSLKKIYDIYLNQSGYKDGNGITYRLDGGTITGEKQCYTILDYGYTPPEPEREGYDFVGWEPASIPQGIGGPFTFTAQWKKIVQEERHITTNLSDIMLTGGAGGEASYEYDGDGTVSVSSENESIATATLDTQAHRILVAYHAPGTTNLVMHASAGKYSQATETRIPVTCKRQDTAVTLTTSTLTLDKNGDGTVAYVYDGDGAVSVRSTDENIATVGLDSAKHAATIHCQKAGECDVSNSAEETNISSAANATCHITCSKESGFVLLSAASGTIDQNSSSASVQITASHGGALSVSRISGNAANATLSGSNITFSRNGNNIGDCIFTVTSAATEQCKEANATYRLSVNKQNGYITLAASSGTISSGGSNASVQVKSSHGGTISVSRTSGNSANASVSGSTINFSRNGNNYGQTKFTVTCGATSSYNAASATFTIDVKQSYITFVFTTGGTNAYYRTGVYLTVPAGSTIASLYNAGYNDSSCTQSGRYLTGSTVYADGNKSSSVGSTRMAITKTGNTYTITGKIFSTWGTCLNTMTTSHLYLYGSWNTISATTELKNGQWYNIVGMN